MDLLLEVKLSPEEQEQYKQALVILQDETLDEGIKDKLKKLGLSATVIAALLASPQLTQAQKSPLEDLAKQTTTTVTPKRVGSSVDGIVGEYTSRYMFPLKSSDTLTSVTKLNGEVIASSQTGEKTAHKMTIATAAKHGLSIDQMKQWNNFIQWMKSKEYAGSSKMNNTAYSWGIVDEYVADGHPDFWVEDEDDVKAVQAALQEERAKIIEQWKAGGKGAPGIKIGGKVMNPNNPEDVATVEKEFMPIVRPVFYTN
jgi:hypothetical protein